jgi:hypothetical protein
MYNYNFSNVRIRNHGLQFSAEKIEKVSSVDMILLVTERISKSYSRVNDFWIPSILKSKVDVLETFL